MQIFKMQAISYLAAILLCTGFARAIEVTSNSLCYATCGGGLTFSTDLTCNDDGYNNTDVGRKMDACLTCESTSTASLPSDGNDTAKNDLYWFLCKKFSLAVSRRSATAYLPRAGLSQYEIYCRDLPFHQHNRHLRYACVRYILQPPADGS
jgi:hypothetical protein